MKKRTNLTRMDHEGCKGWWVRIQRGDKSVSKLFSDGVYGGSRKAEAAATAFRDSQLKKLPARVFKGLKGPRAGAAGYYLRTRMRHGAEEHAWVAIWTVDGRQLEKSFSVNQHGNAAAKRLAKQHRKEMVAMLSTDDKKQARVTSTRKKATTKQAVRSKATAKKSTAKKTVVKKATAKKAGQRKTSAR